MVVTKPVSPEKDAKMAALQFLTAALPSHFKASEIKESKIVDLPSVSESLKRYDLLKKIQA